METHPPLIMDYTWRHKNLELLKNPTKIEKIHQQKIIDKN